MKRLIFASLVLALAASSGLQSLAARTSTPNRDTGSSPVLVNRDKDGLALQGYDPVAYFEDDKPVPGDPRYRSRHDGATYQFASKEHQQMFERDPGRYVPAFGGYCGYAASINKLSPVSPEWFQVIDGRLVLQHNKKAWDLWNQDVPANLAKADANWPGLVARNGTTGRDRLLINVDPAGLALQGYDPVAYFEDGRAVPGDPSIEATYDGGIYRFASSEHKEQFEHDPSRFAPAFGGFCAYAASINKISPINPEIFQIEDGRLLLQHTPKAYDLFNADPKRNLDRADHNWPNLVAKRGK